MGDIWKGKGCKCRYDEMSVLEEFKEFELVNGIVAFANVKSEKIEWGFVFVFPGFEESEIFGWDLFVVENTVADVCA